MLKYIITSLLSTFLCDSDSIRYKITVPDSGIAHEELSFSIEVLRTLSEPDGWPRADVSFCPVAYEPDIDIVLAKPDTVDLLCAPINTGGKVSCAIHGQAIINYKRWTEATKAWDDLADYRRYVINHEVGHIMGMIHRHRCTKSGMAPLMMQQSRDRLKCEPNSYPTSHESLSLKRLRIRRD